MTFTAYNWPLFKWKLFSAPADMMWCTCMVEGNFTHAKFCVPPSTSVIISGTIGLLINEEILFCILWKWQSCDQTLCLLCLISYDENFLSGTCFQQENVLFLQILKHFCIFCNSAKVMEHRNFSSAGRPEPHPFIDVRKISNAAFSAYINSNLHLETRMEMTRY